MKISNHSSLDELIRRSADLDLLKQELEEEDEEEEVESEFDEGQWNDWLKSMGW